MVSTKFMESSCPLILLFVIYFHNLEGLEDDPHRNQKAVTRYSPKTNSDDLFMSASHFNYLDTIYEKDNRTSVFQSLSRIGRRPMDVSDENIQRKKRVFVASSSGSDLHLKSSRKWYEAPRVQYQDFPPESISYTNEKVSFKCQAKGMPVPSVQWYVRYPKGTSFEPVPIGDSITSRRWGFSQHDGEIKFSSLPSSTDSGNTSQSPTSTTIATEVSRFQFYCQASNILGVHRSRIMDVERVPPPRNLKIEYVTHEILPRSRARVSCALSSDQNYFVIDHWELRMEGEIKPFAKIDKSSSKYRFITLVDQPELHILNVTSEELDKLYVRCVYRSTISRDLLTDVQHVTSTPGWGIKLKRLNTDRPTPMVLQLLTRPRVAQGDIVELPCYTLYSQDLVEWFFTAQNSRRESKIDVKQSNGKYTLEPPEPGGNLVINRVDLSDAGTYNCRSSSGRVMGEAMFFLDVTVPLSVNLEPEDNLASLNDTIELNCKVYGYPHGDIQWLYNGRPLVANSGKEVEIGREMNGAITFSSLERIERGNSQRLIISKMTVDHIGVYQCLIQTGDKDSPTLNRRQDNAEDFSMVLMEKLEPQLRHQVPVAEKNDLYRTAQVKLSVNPQVAPSSITLMCQFYGHPEPVIMWYIDDQPVPISTEVTVPQIEDPPPNKDRLVPALAYVKETKLRIDLTKENDHTRLWQYGGEYKAVATNYPSGLKNGKTNKSADCRFMVMMDTKLNIRPMDSVRTCTVGSICTLHCYAIAFTKVKLQWTRIMEGGHEQDVPMDHRQEVVNGGRTLIFREVEESHKGIYQCLAITGNEKKTATIQLKVSFAPQISHFTDVLPVTEGENTVTTLCTSKVNAEKPWFAWWEYRPVENPNSVTHFCDQNEGNSISIMYGRGPLSELGERDKDWIQNLPCMKKSSDWLRYANRVPTLNINHLNRTQHHGKFTCVIQNSVGMDQLAMNITFTPEYQFRKKPPNKLAVTLGDSVNVDCEAKSDNYAPPIVEWRYVKDGGTYDKVPQISRDGRYGFSGYGQYENGTLSLWNVEEEIPRKYYCFLLPRPDSKAKAKSTAVNVDINIPASISPLADPMEVRKGSTFNMTCDVRGDPDGMSVTWYHMRKDGINRHEMTPITTLCEFDGKKNAPEDANVVLSDDSDEPVEEEMDKKHCLTPLSVSDESTRRMKQFFVYKSNGKGMINHLQLSDVTERESTEYKCTAKNKYNKNGEASIIRVLLKVVSRPSVVKLSQYVDIAATWVKFKWLRPESDGGKSIRNYKVSYFTTDFLEPNGTIVPKVKNVNDVNLKEVTVDALRPFTNYTFSVVAVNEVGESDGAVLNVTTKPAEPDGPVLHLRANGTASDVIEVQWDPPARDKRNGIIIGYNLCYLRKKNQSQSAESMDWKQDVVPRNPLSAISEELFVKACVDVQHTRYEILGLPKFTEYGIRVIAVNEKGNSPLAYTSARTMEDLPQEPPSRVTCMPDVDRCTVQWNPPKPETINGVLTGYIITYFPTNDLGDESSRRQENVSKSTRHVLKALQPYTNYTIHVQAQNSKGVGPPSPAVTCATKEGKPGPVRSAKALVMNDTCIVVSWLAPDQPNGRIKEYCVTVKGNTKTPKRICKPPRPDVQQWQIICDLSSIDNYNVDIYPKTIFPGDEYKLKDRISPTGNPKDAIISIGHTLQAVTNMPTSLDCLTVYFFRPSLSRIRYWDTPRNTPRQTDGRFNFEPNGTLFISSVMKSDAGAYSCHTQEESISYALQVEEKKKEAPKAPIWQQKTANPHGIQVTWLSKGSFTADTPITGFLLEWFNLNTGDFKEVTLRENERSYYLNPLPCATAVRFRIRAQNSIGAGQWSDPVIYNTTGKAPIIGNDLQLTHHKGHTWVFMNLTSKFSPGDGCWPEVYHVLFTPSRAGQNSWNHETDVIINQTISRASLLSHCCWNVTGLQTNSQYNYFINAINAAGNSSVSGVVHTMPLDVPTSPSLIHTTKVPELGWYTQPIILIPLVVSLFVLILLIITLLLCAKRRYMEEQHSKPPVIVHQKDIKGGPNVAGMRSGQYQRSTAANQPLPDKPIYNSQESKVSKVYSQGNSSDLPIIYPSHRRASEDAHSVLSYNSECDPGTLGGDIEPYAVYERNGYRVGGPGGGEFISTDPMTMSITSASGGNGVMRQRSRRSGSGSSGGPSAMGGTHRQMSQPAQSAMTSSTHLGGNGGGAYHYPQFLGGQPIMTGTMRPTRLGGGGLASHRLDEEVGGGTPTGRKSSSLDCLHKIGADIPDHHRFPPGPLPSDILRGFPPQNYSHGQPQPPTQLIAPQNSIQPAGIRPQPNNGNDAVYRGGTSTVSSNHDELAQAYEASAYPMGTNGAFGPHGATVNNSGAFMTQTRPALMPSTTAALTNSIPITSTQQPLQQTLPPGNDSSGSSIDPGIREFTQQPPRPAETRQAVCHVGGVSGAGIIADPAQRQPAPANGAAGRRPMNNTRPAGGGAGGIPRHNYQRGISDISDTYDTIENAAYYPAIPTHNMPTRTYAVAPTQIIPGVGRHPNHPQELQQRQPLLAANEEWAEAAGHEQYTRGGHMPYKTGGRPPFQSTVASNMIHPRELAAARGDARCIPPQPQAVVPQMSNVSGPYHPEKRSLLGAPSSSMGMAAAPPSNPHWIVPTVSVNVNNPHNQQSQTAPTHPNDEDDEEDPYTDKFTMV